MRPFGPLLAGGAQVEALEDEVPPATQLYQRTILGLEEWNQDAWTISYQA